MTLFDDIERDELQTGTRFVSLFRDINYYDWAGADKARNRLESWFEKYPDPHKTDLRARFRSGDDYNHEAAFFEVFLHELLIRLGFSLTVHPEIPDTEDRPDFLACRDNQRFYLEATVTGKEAGPYTRNRNEQDVINKLNRLSSPNFRMTIHIQGKLSQTLSYDRVVCPFRKLLDDNEPDEVQRKINEHGRNEAPSKRIKCGGWSLEGWLWPISPKQRRKGLERPFIIGNHRAQRTDCVTPVRKAIKNKAKKYGELDAPFIVAVHSRDPFYHDRDHDMEVLFGNERLLYFEDQPDLPPKLDCKHNGIWPGQSRIDAFLRFYGVDLRNLWHSATACLYVNPYKSGPGLPVNFFRLPHAMGRDGKMEWSEGEEITEILGIQ